MRHPTVVLIGLVLPLALAACSGNADPSPAPSTPPATSSTPSASSTAPTQSPTPTPPPMPQAAKAHTKAGAKAFVQYFWDVVDYAQHSGDTAGISALSVHGCKGCEAGSRGIDRVYSAGGSIRGGETTASNFMVDLLKAGDLEMAHVTVRLRFAAQTIDMPGSAKDNISKASAARDRLELLAVEDGWKVAQLVVLP